MTRTAASSTSKTTLLILAVGAFAVAVFFATFFYKDGYRNGYLQAERDAFTTLSKCEIHRTDNPWFSEEFIEWQNCLYSDNINKLSGD